MPAKKERLYKSERCAKRSVPPILRELSDKLADRVQSVVEGAQETGSVWELTPFVPTGYSERTVRAADGTTRFPPPTDTEMKTVRLQFQADIFADVTNRGTIKEIQFNLMALADELLEIAANLGKRPRRR